MARLIFTSTPHSAAHSGKTLVNQRRNKIIVICFVVLISIVIGFGCFLIYCKQQNKGYRLGDMVKFRKWRNKITGKFYHCLLFPNSIACKYMKKTNNDNDFEVLSNIILHNKYSKYKYNDRIVIHVRTGDVFDHPTCKVPLQTIVDKGCRNQLFKPFSYYKDELKQIPNSIKKITILSGNHMFVKSTKSLQYLELLKQQFVDLGYEVQILYNQPPDKDFTIMSLAKYFIPSGGGFSSLAQELNEYITSHTAPRSSPPPHHPRTHPSAARHAVGG